MFILSSSCSDGDTVSGVGGAVLPNVEHLFCGKQSQQILCITLHNLNLTAKSKKPPVQNPNETGFEESPGKLDQTSN